MYAFIDLLEFLRLEWRTITSSNAESDLGSFFLLPFLMAMGGIPMTEQRSHRIIPSIAPLSSYWEGTMERSGRENVGLGVLPLVSLGLLGKLLHILRTSFLVYKMESVSSLWDWGWDPLRKHLGEWFINVKSLFTWGFFMFAIFITRETKHASFIFRPHVISNIVLATIWPTG